MFIGRKKELQELESLKSAKNISFVVVKGRRRIGKSTLVRKFAEKATHYYEFSGLAPSEKTTAADQRTEFTKQMAHQGLPGVQSSDWSDIFWHLSKHLQHKNTILFLDEISWMADKDETFLPKLKNAWELHFSKHAKIMLIVCGSISSWIDKNLLSSTGFLGRVDLEMTVPELSLKQCNEFWGSKKEHISINEKITLLSVTGGVPKYLEDLRINDRAEDNILRMCFKPSGFLFNEFEKIFHDLFDRRAAIYQTLLKALIDGNQSLTQLLAKTKLEKSGVYTEYLADLETAGFVSRDYTWDLEKGTESKLNHYRIRDNYVRFYLKYIHPNRKQISKGNWSTALIAKLPQWSTLMGLQFENLVLANRTRIFELLRLSPDEVLNDGPYFQTKTKLKSGCQIDYLIQTRSKNLFVCEIKRSSATISKSVIADVKNKIDAMKIPRFFSVRPVLIYCGDIHPLVLESQFFDRVISANELMDCFN